MITDVLKPSLDLLGQEYVLVQAWKKTASYIRYHNWYSDTLELDRTAINLPSFIAYLRERLQSADEWENGYLRIVPAPKSQHWRVPPNSNTWEPKERGANAAQLRPLAYVRLEEQVVATAVMLCLADRVETRQGDPRASVIDIESRKQVVSYGNRLFCDTVSAGLRHRWGSAKLYRAYYQDYRSFLFRPEAVAQEVQGDDGRRVIIIHSDLRQFYDRVRPELLTTALQRLQTGEDDPRFFTFASKVFDWRWHTWDRRDVAIYEEQAQIEDFSRVALPQGLVSAGFFANVTLLTFDDQLRGLIGSHIAPGVHLLDICRYVDDFRIVVTVERSQELEDVKSLVSDWLLGLLNQHASSLKLATDKTKAAEFGGSECPLIRQSAKMNRIQSAVSGGFDAIGGEEILESIQGLIRSQHVLNSKSDESGWRFSPVPDVKDETVARFAAARFRKTFRSLRPLLEDGHLSEDLESATSKEHPESRLSRARTQDDLDDEVRAFALGLVERWVEDPSNVRLLRIGLDLWPDAKVLNAVLDLIKPFTVKGGRRKAPRRIAWYCLSEILRAGATETGFVADDECLPAGLDLSEYRNVLGAEAARLVSLPGATIPWYLRQQALLFLAAHNPSSAPVVRTGQSAETKLYREVIRFLRGEADRLKSSDFAALAVLCRRSFIDEKRAVTLTCQDLTPVRQRRIAEKDPSFALELINLTELLFDGLSPRLREDLCLSVAETEFRSLSQIVLEDGPVGPLRNELALLHFAVMFLRTLQKNSEDLHVITPGQVRLNLRLRDGTANIEHLEIVVSRLDPTGSLYKPPDWCPQDERWRFQLGFLLRFILARHADFTRSVRPPRWSENKPMYRVPESHWYLRIYGLFNGQRAFGDDWLPISDWVEKLLSALLHWPGSRIPDDFRWVAEGVEETLRHLDQRISELQQMYGSSMRTLILPMIASRPTRYVIRRPLRACIVQTAIPGPRDFDEDDLTFSSRVIRRRHRNHVSAALAAVERMLILRDTHKEAAGRLDWLILPELAVHPRDVFTHLIPFARAHKTVVLAGLTYESLFSQEPAVNSALWIIPEWTDAHGLQLRIRRQGKYHLAPDEESFNDNGTRRLQGFRPCQWLVGYPWSADAADRPMWMTAAVCYDATDLGLAADLRNQSDILAIPALNKDVQTFDQMALALHYHMFQLVVVANNGQYGGSNAYWPTSDVHVRQVFHLHGQPQASIAFLEIEDIAGFLTRRSNLTSGTWKYPPAGLGRG